MLDYVSKHDLIETISRKLTPKTVGEMLDWADWLWYHFDTYTNALKGAVRYFLGDIDIEAKNDSNNGDERRKITTELFRDYDIMDLLGRVGDEFIQWGNCFTSIEPVTKRNLYCPDCHSTVPAMLVDRLMFRASDAPDKPCFFGDCPVCRRNVGFRHFETIDDSKPLRVTFWNPRLVGIVYCPTTKESEYYVAPSEVWKEAWSQGEPHFIADTPVEILTAMQRGMRIHMNKDFFFHARTPSPSTREDLLKGWGMPLFMNCFPKCVQIMLLDKFDESIIADHVVPFTVISPSPQGSGNQPSDDPLRTVNMGSFREQMERMVSRHRANPSYIQIAPYAIQYQLLGGEAKQLVPVDLRAQKVQDLLQAMNILDFSQMQGQGGPPPNLRFFEKVWGIHINTLNRWGQWLCDCRTKIIKSTPVNFSLVKSSIYENDMSIEYKSKLGMGGVISMDTALRPLGIDYELEQVKLRDEQMRAAEIAQHDQEDSAKADEIKASVYAPQPGTSQLMAAQQGGAAGAPPPAGGGMPPMGGGGAVPGTGAADINGMWDQAMQMAQQLLTMPESERKSQLINLSKTNPQLHSFVKSQLEQMERQAAQQGKVMARQGQM